MTNKLYGQIPSPFEMTDDCFPPETRREVVDADGRARLFEFSRQYDGKYMVNTIYRLEARVPGREESDVLDYILNPGATAGRAEAEAESQGIQTWALPLGERIRLRKEYEKVHGSIVSVNVRPVVTRQFSTADQVYLLNTLVRLDRFLERFQRQRQKGETWIYSREGGLTDQVTYEVSPLIDQKGHFTITSNEIQQ